MVEWRTSCEMDVRVDTVARAYLRVCVYACVLADVRVCVYVDGCERVFQWVRCVRGYGGVSVCWYV